MDVVSTNKNLPAIMVMVAAAALFTIMDAGMKLLAQHYPPMQVTALRSLSSLPFVYVYVAWRSSFAAMLQVRWPLHLLRGALAVVMLVTFVIGLHHLALTETYTIFYVAPLLITALSVPLLGERVGRGALGRDRHRHARRADRAATHRLGRVHARRAGGHRLGGLLHLLGDRGAHPRAHRFDGEPDVLADLDARPSARLLLAWPHWQALRPQDAWLIAGVGLTGFCGQWGVTYAFRHGEVSAIAPFEYTALIWSLGLDRLIWQTTPDHYTLLGAAVIIGSGVFLVRREKVHAEAEHP